MSKGITTLTLGPNGRSRQVCEFLTISEALDRSLIPSETHRRDHFAILYLQDASGTVNVDTKMLKVEGEGVLVLHPSTVYLFDWHSTPTGHVVLFTPDFFSVRYNENVLSSFQCLRSGAERFIGIHHEGHRRRLNTVMSLIADEAPWGRKDSANVLRSCLNILLVELDRMMGPGEPVLDKRAGPLKLKAFLALVEEEFAREKNPAEYARRLHITPNYLNKIVREHQGCTAGELIRARVVLEAERLLMHTDLTVNQIADRLGYDNVPWFITFFKRSTGLSPRQFREQH